MKAIALPDQQVLKDLFNYDPDTGLLTWAKRDRKYFKKDWAYTKFNKYNAGKPALTSLDGEGYMYGGVSINGIRTFFKAHRVIWKLLYNEDPEQIDHDNRIRTDNRKVNLVKASASMNAQNRKLRSDNSTGYNGVSKTATNKYMARIGTKCIGTFSTALQASEAYENEKLKQGYHPNHGNTLLKAVSEHEQA